MLGFQKEQERKEQKRKRKRKIQRKDGINLGYYLFSRRPFR